VNDDIMTLMI